MPPPASSKSLQRALGFFAYYAKWVPGFSDKIHILKTTKSFPLDQKQLNSFRDLKKAIASATLSAVDEASEFVVECDASDVAVSATLNQNGRPVAFMSRALHGGELHYPAMEKEATSIIEAVRKWAHFLVRKHFTLITDQRSVAFMFDSRRRTKVKNNKVLGWRLELASFSYTIRYRPGKLNVASDALSRAHCGSLSTGKINSLMDIHKELCCPGVTRLLQFVRSKNLPFSTNDVKEVCNRCPTCSEIKPRFFTSPPNTLIKATQPMERLNIDFKGPLPSQTRNVYLFCVIDEYSRFPFCFPCQDTSSRTVINCLSQLFNLFGYCSYIHSDRAKSFLSREVKRFLLERGVATSHSTPYHPQGNSQVERYNGVIWKAISCILKSRNLPIKAWESVLPQVMHALRSLICTSTNATPHEKFSNFSRRSSLGKSLPDWLSSPGPVFVRKFVRNGKTDDLVVRANLIEANPTYARVRYEDGREVNVSLQDLAQFNDRRQSDADLLDRGSDADSQDEAQNLDLSTSRSQLSSKDPASEENATGSPNNDDSFSNVPCNDSEMGPGVSDGLTPRRSNRSNKGIPPLRYGNPVSH